MQPTRHGRSTPRPPCRSARANSEGLASFAESAASGSLLFTDASNNSVFSLDPQRAIAPGQTLMLS